MPRQVLFASCTVEVTALAVKHVSMQRVGKIWAALVIYPCHVHAVFLTGRVF